MSDTSTPLFSEERRAKAELGNTFSNALVSILKGKADNIKDGKYNRSFSDGYQAGIAYSLGVLGNLVLEAQVNDTASDLIDGYGAALAESLRIVKSMETYE